MKETKYLSSNGLAFSEEKEMKKLSDFAKKGWILQGFAPLGYRLKRGEPQNIIYSLDYQRSVDEEYFEIFKAAQWSHVCSLADEIHIFSAPEGTKPIYSDKETKIDKYEREKNKLGKNFFWFSIIMIILRIISSMARYDWIPEMVGTISRLLIIPAIVVVIFNGMPYIAFRYKLNKLINS